jgi:penicillin-binding protein 1A
MMELVVDSGTARSARTRFNLKSDLAAKTGTTQNNADGWFMAITPRIICGSWVGAQSPIVHFRSTALGQGAATALPITASWLRKVEQDRELPNMLGRSFPDHPEIELSLLCPSFIESRTENFFDQLFDGDRREKRRELRSQSEKASDSSDEKKKKGWVDRLMDKLSGDD